MRIKKYSPLPVFYRGQLDHSPVNDCSSELNSSKHKHINNVWHTMAKSPSKRSNTYTKTRQWVQRKGYSVTCTYCTLVTERSWTKIMKKGTKILINSKTHLENILKEWKECVLCIHMKTVTLTTKDFTAWNWRMLCKTWHLVASGRNAGESVWKETKLGPT